MNTECRINVTTISRATFRTRDSCRSGLQDLSVFREIFTERETRGRICPRVPISIYRKSFFITRLNRHRLVHRFLTGSSEEESVAMKKEKHRWEREGEKERDLSVSKRRLVRSNTEPARYV